ncbi:MAG: Crp/Fnr family transcriptional regulator [Chitinophagaceae bacterium]|nr:Crp/Fnr family transcriptional regulator [Chitinophagaceae bacterium]
MVSVVRGSTFDMESEVVVSLADMQEFWEKINSYGRLSDEGRLAWEGILRQRTYDKNDFFVQEGQVPRMVAFVSRGLFSQYFCADNGDTVIKRFFPDGYFVASTSALLTNSPSVFAIRALEPSVVWEYNFLEFKKLTEKLPEIAGFYIRYLELHWVIEKEPLEISFRLDTAKTRYLNFLKSYPKLEPRLKQHEIASYLGVTPTQLSRIRSEL